MYDKRRSCDSGLLERLPTPLTPGVSVRSLFPATLAFQEIRWPVRYWTFSVRADVPVEKRISKTDRVAVWPCGAVTIGRHRYIGPRKVIGDARLGIRTFWH